MALRHKPTSTQWVVASAWFSRLVSAFVSIYTLRVLSQSLTATEYASFVVIVGLGGWYAMSDFGLGYATQNTVTRKLALAQNPGSDILAAYCMLAVSAIFLCSTVLWFSEPLAVRLLGRLGDPATNTSRFAWCSIVLLLAGIATIVNKLLYAVHRGYVANLATAASSIAGFVILKAGAYGIGDRVIFAVVALNGPTLLFASGLAFTQLRGTWGAWSLIRRADVIKTLHAALGFLVFTALAAAVLQVDYIILSQKVDPVDLIQYYNLARLFGFVAFFNQAVMFASWPVFTADFANGRYALVSARINQLMCSGVAVTIAAAAALFLASKPLSAFLSPGTAVEFSPGAVGGFTAIALARCITDPSAIFLQSIGKMRPLITFAAIQALISGALQWVLAGLFGIEGVLIAIALSFLLTVVWGLSSSTRLQLSTSYEPKAKTD